MRERSTWENTRAWCLDNPNKQAAIVTPAGAFVITFRPRPATPSGVLFVADRETHVDAEIPGLVR